MSKKIVVSVLILCLLCSCLPVMAKTLYPADFDANGEINTTADIIINPSGVFVRGNDEAVRLIQSGKVAKIIATLQFGDVTVALNNVAEDAPSAKIWFTSVFAQNGTLANRMIEDANANEVLKAGLVVDGDGTVITADVNTFKSNIIKYLHYMLNGNTDVVPAEGFTLSKQNITLKGVGTEADDAFPDGTFFLSSDKINTFIGDEWVGNYVVSGNYSNMYRSTVSTSLDGPYTVFVAPATGVYDVLAFKRENASESSNRDIKLIIADEKFTFARDNAGSVMSYYWVYAADNKTVSLKKGQKVSVRVPYDSHGSEWSGTYGLAFVPRTGNEKVLIPNTAKPNTSDALKKAVSASAVTIDNSATAYVAVNGTRITVSANEAETYFPNIDLSDVKGQYIETPTILDAVVAATKAGVDGLPFDLKPNTLEGGTLSLNLESDKVTPITYDSTTQGGASWPTNSGNSGYSTLWNDKEVLYLANGGNFTMNVTAPQAGEYYLFGNGCAWGTRYVEIKVNGTKVLPGNGDAGFFLSVGAGGMENQCTQEPVSLNKGVNTVSITAVGGVVRVDHLAFVKADSYDAAVAIQNEITTSKDTFNAYFASSGSTFTNGKITDYEDAIIVNNNAYMDDFDKITIADGDVITFGGIDSSNFAPISMEAFISNNSPLEAGYDNLVEQGIMTVGNKLLLKNINALPSYIKDETVDGMAGCYLNGYIVMPTDITEDVKYGNSVKYKATDGDETKVIIPVHDLKIEHSYNTGSRFEAGYLGNLSKYGTTEVQLEDGKTYCLGIPSLGTAVYDYDFSHLYLTNTNSADDLKITATKITDGEYEISTTKSILVSLIRVKKDGNVIVSTEMEHVVLDFTTPLEVQLAKDEVVYVWEGAILKDAGTTMNPLTAPLTY